MFKIWIQECDEKELEEIKNWLNDILVKEEGERAVINFKKHPVLDKKKKRNDNLKNDKNQE